MNIGLIAKRMDLYAQLLALILPFIIGCYYQETLYFFYAYFSVGGAQVLSAIANRCLLHRELRHETRGAYEWLLGIILVSAACCWWFRLEEPALGGLFILLILSPIMAIWYWFLCLSEEKKLHVLAHRKDWV